MAYINDVYIHVKQESLDDTSELSTHPVESGIDITDTTKKNPHSISLSGLIVDYWTGSKWVKAAEVFEKLTQLKNSGAVVRYSGRIISYSSQIKSIKTSRTNEIAGGAEFDIELQEFRAAKNSYIEPVKTETDSNVNDGGSQQVDKGENEEVYYTVKKGDNVWSLVEKSNAPYKNLSRPAINGKSYSASDWVMAQNPTAFSRKGDFRTLQVGKILLMGYRK